MRKALRKPEEINNHLYGLSNSSSTTKRANIKRNLNGVVRWGSFFQSTGQNDNGIPVTHLFG